MKQSYTEKQIEILAEELFCKTVKVIPDVSDVEVLYEPVSTSFDKAFLLHFKDGFRIRFEMTVKKNGERRYAREFIYSKRLAAKLCGYIFAAPYISKESGDLISENRLSYLDLSGNCELVCDRFYISVQGKTNAFAYKKEHKSIFAISSFASSAILRTMLRDPEHWWQVKELSEKSGAALGSVSNVKSFLSDREWVSEQEGRFRIIEHRRLLEAWAKEYYKKSSLSYEYYSLDPVPEIERKASLFSRNHDGEVFLGGFSAGARYAPAVRYNKVNIYIERQHLNELEIELDLKKVENGGNVIVTIPHDGTVIIDSREINGNPVVSPVQTCIDLLGEHSRGEEAFDAVVRKVYE